MSKQMPPGFIFLRIGETIVHSKAGKLAFGNLKSELLEQIRGVFSNHVLANLPAKIAKSIAEKTAKQSPNDPFGQYATLMHVTDKHLGEDLVISFNDTWRSTVVDALLEVLLKRFLEQGHITRQILEQFDAVCDSVWGAIYETKEVSRTVVTNSLIDRLNTHSPLVYPNYQEDRVDAFMFMALVVSMARADGVKSSKLPVLDKSETNYFSPLALRLGNNALVEFFSHCRFLAYAQLPIESLIDRLSPSAKLDLMAWVSQLSQVAKHGNETAILEFLLKQRKVRRVRLGQKAFDALMKAVSEKIPNPETFKWSFPDQSTSLDERMAFFAVCSRMVIADRRVTSEEQSSLKDIEKSLGLTPKDLESLPRFLALTLSDTVALISAEHRAFLLAEMFFLALTDSEQSPVEMKLMQTTWQEAAIDKNQWSVMRTVFSALKDKFGDGRDAFSEYCIRGLTTYPPDIPKLASADEASAFLALCFRSLPENSSPHKLTDLARTLNVELLFEFLKSYDSARSFWNFFDKDKLTRPLLGSALSLVGNRYHQALYYEALTMCVANGELDKKEMTFITALKWDAESFSLGGWEEEVTVLLRVYFHTGYLVRRFDQTHQATG